MIKFIPASLLLSSLLCATTNVDAFSFHVNSNTRSLLLTNHQRASSSSSVVTMSATTNTNSENKVAASSKNNNKNGKKKKVSSSKAAKPSSSSPPKKMSSSLQSSKKNSNYERRKNNLKAVTAGVKVVAKGVDPKKFNKRMEAKKKRVAANQKKKDEVIYNRVMADMIFDLIDRNHDGGISYDELIAYLEEEKIIRKDNNGRDPSLIDGTFDNTDVDNNNRLSIRYLFTALDKNADGRISREEMQFAFENYEVPALYNAFGLEDSVTQSVYSDAVTTIRQEQRKSTDELTSVGDSSSDYDDDNDSSSDAVTSEANAELLVKLADLIFDRIDTDQSGEIDAVELRTHFTAQFFSEETVNDEIPAVRRGLSPSGLVENAASDESTTTLSENDPATTASLKVKSMTASLKVESILEALDLNHDGVISRDEMRQGFQQYDPRALSKALGLPVLFCE